MRVSSSSRSSQGSSFSSVSQDNKKKKETAKQRNRRLQLESDCQSEVTKIKKNWPAGKGPLQFLKVGRIVPFKAFYGVCLDDVRKGGVIYGGCGQQGQKVKGKYSCFITFFNDCFTSLY